MVVVTPVYKINAPNKAKNTPGPILVTDIVATADLKLPLDSVFSSAIEKSLYPSQMERILPKAMTMRSNNRSVSSKLRHYALSPPRPHSSPRRSHVPFPYADHKRGRRLCLDLGRHWIKVRNARAGYKWAKHSICHGGFGPYRCAVLWGLRRSLIEQSDDEILCRLEFHTDKGFCVLRGDV